jgi:MFS family permease
MRTRLVLGAVGVAMGAFGALRLLQLDLEDLLDAVLWLAGGVLLHDVVVAPLTIAVTLLATRVVPSRARTAVVVGVVVLATVTVTAIPVLGGWGVRADNPTLLDRDYTAGWLVLAGLVVLGVVLGLVLAPVLALARRRRMHRE